MTYNPEKRVWRGKSYKKGGKLIKRLREDQPVEDTDVDDAEAYGPLSEYYQEYENY